MNSLVTEEMKQACRAETKAHVNNGTIPKKPCEVCGKLDVQAHHTDYTKPFQVQWLCYPHHLIAHGRRYRFGKSGQMRHEKVKDSRNRPVRGLWARAGIYYIQTRIKGSKSPARLRLYNTDGTDPQTVPQAIAAMQSVLVDKRAGKAPMLKSETLTVGDICQRYLDEGCPSRNDGKRAGKEPEKEIFRVEMLMRSPLAGIQASALTAKDWDRYRAWRVTQLRSRTNGTAAGRGGDSVVDHERVALSNVYRQAVWHSDQTKIEINRVTALNFKRYRQPSQVVHCRSHKPRSGDELHQLALHAFTSGPRTEVLGWFLLFTARIGHRANAMLTLRADAKFPASSEWPEPGYVGNGNIYLYRSETSKGCVGHLEIDSHLQDMIDAHRAWLARRHPDSPWYFPSPYCEGQSISAEALTHWLDLECPKLGIGHRTTHGLRSFRCTCLRSQGKSAAECAELLGQKSAGRLVMQVYGERVDCVVDWMPKGDPAWKVFDGQQAAVA